MEKKENTRRIRTLGQKNKIPQKPVEYNCINQIIGRFIIWFLHRLDT